MCIRDRAYTGVESADNYDQIYQSDLLGWTGSIGYNEPLAWFSSVYQAEQTSTVQAAGFYATDADTYYDIYLVENFEGIEDMDRRVLLQSGYIEDKGYYTIPLRNQQIVEGGERFAVIVQIYTKGSSHPVAIELSLIHISPQDKISHSKEVRPLEDDEVDRAGVEGQ